MSDEVFDADIRRAIAASLEDAALCNPTLLPAIKTANFGDAFRDASSCPIAASALCGFTSPHTPRLPPTRDPNPPLHRQPSRLAPVPPPLGQAAPIPSALLAPAPSGAQPNKDHCVAARVSTLSMASMKGLIKAT